MLYLGMNIGGTKCSTAIGESTPTCKIALKAVSPTRKTSEYTPLEMLDTLCDDMLALMAQLNVTQKDIAGVGISCGSPLDSQQGIILSPPNLPGWDSVPVVAHIKKRLGLCAWLCNDANAGALAEWYSGAGQGKQDIVFLTFGTGMGAGIIAEGILLKGASDMAGEIGHMRMAEYGPVGNGKIGSFEGFCSGGGIAQLAQMYIRAEVQAGRNAGALGKIPLEKIDAKAVGQAAALGDAAALELMQIIGTQLGKGVSVLIDLLNPACIIIGSIYARCEALLSPPMQKVIEQETLPLSRKACVIVPAQLSESIGEVSALSIAVYYHNRQTATL